MSRVRTWENGVLISDEDVGDAPTSPLIPSKTAFNEYGWARVGMARHQAILEAAENRPGTADLDYQVRAAFNQYQSAGTFEKAKVDSFVAVLVAAGIMTADERSSYIDNWPEA